MICMYTRLKNNKYKIGGGGWIQDGGIKMNMIPW